MKKIFNTIHSKKRYTIPFYLLLAYVALNICLVKFSGDPDFNTLLLNKRINDITGLNPTHVNKEIKPKTSKEIIDAIKSTTGPISIGGGRFSMGGQTAYENSLHIDMRQFNKVLSFDIPKKQITVQSGMVWRDLQNIIDEQNLSVKIMQTYANFTVGGSISVNCHGRYIGHGPIISSVIEIKLITASGEVIMANRKENTDVFNAAIGGFGGIGVITEVTLQLVDNVKVERQTKIVDVSDYNVFFNENIRNNSSVIFQNGDLYPPNFEIVNNVSYVITDNELTDTTRVTPEGQNYWLEPKLVEVTSWGGLGKWLRRKVIDPFIYSSEKVVWRNKEASYDVAELEPGSREKYTYVLQEYFIPVQNILSFIPKMRSIYDEYDVNVINVSLRHASPDHESFLSWASTEVFAFVIYYKQGTDAESMDHVKEWTVKMTDAILSENGKWYLPYQPHASVEQFRQAYPNSNRYFEVKDRLDPLHRFNNKLLDKYNPYLRSIIEKHRDHIDGYYRDEQQTILTIPEWYLVFNPKEYADFLEAGKDPSGFPFLASIKEYWKLYDRSMMLVSEAYPKNEEYITMLQVIGISITMEYSFKMIYENSIGALFGLFSDKVISKEEQVIIKAHRAYSDFIYHTAWYEFEFLPWIRKVWNSSDTNDASWLRKWERTFFFSAEFFFKAVYAQLIEWAAEASYEEPVTDIYLLVSTEEQIDPTDDIKILKEQGSEKIIGITRWGAFTNTIMELSTKNIQIHEIAGNDEIAVSVLVDEGADVNFKNAELLFNSSVVTNHRKMRAVYLLPVEELLPFVQQAKKSSFEVEHVFDY